MKKQIKQTITEEEPVSSPQQQEDDSMDNSFDSKSFNVLRSDNELFDEECYIPNKIINVKRVDLPHGGIDWKILEDNKVVLLLKGTRFTKSERDFLSSGKGMTFIISEYKSSNIKSIVKLKEKLKKLKLI